MSKRNNSQPDNSNANLPPPMPHQVEAVVCPVEVWDQIKIALRKLTIEDGEVILMTMKSMRSQIVTMQQPEGMPMPGQRPVNPPQ